LALSEKAIAGASKKDQ